VRDRHGRSTGQALVSGAASEHGSFSGAAGLEPVTGYGTAAGAAARPAISSRGRIYMADQVSNTITVIGPSINEVHGTLPLGEARLDAFFVPVYYREINTHGLGFAPDGRSLAAINVTTNSAVVIYSTLRIGQQPQTLVYVPNAVPQGDGRAYLTRQALDKHIEHFTALSRSRAARHTPRCAS